MQALILDRKLKSLVATERKLTHEILLIIQTLDITKSYRELGYSSLFTYLTKAIGYSDGSAQRRISSARLMKQVPVLETELKSGALNLTQLALTQIAIKQEEKSSGEKISAEKKEEILEKLKTKNTFETQKILKENLPSFEVPKPKALPSGSGKICVTLEFSESEWQKVQDLMAHFSHSAPDQKLESLLLYWYKQVEVKRQKQKEKALATKVQPEMTKPEQTEMTKTELKTTPSNSMSTNAPSEAKKQKRKDRAAKNLKSSENLLPLRQWPARKYIPIQFQTQVKAQGRYQCGYISPITGQKCGSKHFLEIEHAVPVAMGGQNKIENLRLLCRSHNQLLAKQWGISEFAKQ